MKNIMQTLPVVLIALFSSSCPAYDEAVSLETLMNGLQECLRQISTMSADVEVRELAEWHPNHGEMEKTQNVSKFVLHRDEQRVEWIGQSSTLNAEGLPIEAAGFQIREICDGQRYIRLHQFESSKGALTALIKTDYREDVERSLDHPRFCSPLYGRIYGNSHLDLHALLASGTTELHQGQEEIKGYNCYVVAAQTPHGLVTAWIAPEVGFNAVKWSIVKSSANFFNDQKLQEIDCQAWDASFLVDDIQTLDDRHVITSGTLTQKTIHSNGFSTISSHYLLTNADISPDFNKIGAFQLKLPEGTVVYDHDIPGIRFEYVKGDLVPIVDQYAIDVIEGTASELREDAPFTETHNLPEAPPDASDAKEQDSIPIPHLNGNGGIPARRIICATVLVLTGAFAILFFKTRLGREK